MNYKRGFLRIWVIASILWIGVPVTIYFNQFERWIDSKSECPPSEGNVLSFCEMQKLAAEGDLKQYQSGQHDRWNDLPEFVALSMLPPIVVLGLIYVLAWVGRGFGKD